MNSLNEIINDHVENKLDSSLKLFMIKRGIF